MAMKIIHLDASNWTEISDFLHALLDAIGVPDGSLHPQAVMEYMIWDNNPTWGDDPDLRREFKSLAPPYVVRITGTKDIPVAVRDYIDMIQDFINWSRWEFRGRSNGDVEISMETDTGAPVANDGFKVLARQFHSKAFERHGSLAAIVPAAVATLDDTERRDVRALLDGLIDGKHSPEGMMRVWRSTLADIGPTDVASYPAFFRVIRSAIE